MADESVMVFIDNSNTWIEGKKKYAAQHSRAISEDPRWRISFEKLYHLVVQGRNLRYGCMYGSESPADDAAVWEKAERKLNNFDVRRFKRSKVTKKEKIVDPAIASDAGYQIGLLAARLAAGDQIDPTVLVLVSADGDFTHTIDLALWTGLRVEVWGFDSGMSDDLKMKGRMNPMLTINKMDDVIERISFVAADWRGPIPLDHTLVFPDLLKRDVATIQTVRAWTDRRSWPPFYAVEDKSLVCVFPYAFREPAHFDAIIFEGTEQLPVAPVAYFSWIRSRANPDARAAMRSVDDGRPRLPAKATRATSAAAAAAAPVTEWQSVRTELARERKPLPMKRCRWGKHCPCGVTFGSRCKFYHTKEEVAYFEACGGHGKGATKCKRCPHAACHFSMEPWRCPGVHPGEAFYCPTCDVWGHEMLTPACPSALHC